MNFCFPEKKKRWMKASVSERRGHPLEIKKLLSWACCVPALVSRVLTWTEDELLGRVRQLGTAVKQLALDQLVHNF